jgi:hypothetical protein
MSMIRVSRRASPNERHFGLISQGLYDPPMLRSAIDRPEMGLGVTYLRVAVAVRATLTRQVS